MGSDRVALNPSPARLRCVSMDSSTRTRSCVPKGIVVFGTSGADSVAGFAPAATCAVGHGVCVLEHPASSITGTIQSHTRIIRNQCTADANAQPLHIRDRKSPV